MSDPSSRVQWFIFEWRYSAVCLAASVFLLLMAVFGAAGSFTGDAPWYFSSQRAYEGMLLMMIIAPTYFAFVFIIGWRRSLELAETIDSFYATGLAATARLAPMRVFLVWGAIGFLYAVLFNIPGHGLTFFVTDNVEQSMIFGQLFIWTTITSLVGFRIRLALAFNRASARVDIDLFETSHLKPFAQLGLFDVLVIVGALVISTLQSLDFSFRPDNYSNAIVVALPAMLFLAIYPMHGLHRRMAVLKAAQLEELNRSIAASPKDLDSDNVQRLEILLQRRERVQHAPTWPIDISIVQRFLFYIVIPPLAWIGAALVEFAIDGFLG